MKKSILLLTFILTISCSKEEIPESEPLRYLVEGEGQILGITYISKGNIYMTHYYEKEGESDVDLPWEFYNDHFDARRAYVSVAVKFRDLDNIKRLAIYLSGELVAEETNIPNAEDSDAITTIGVTYERYDQKLDSDRVN